MRKKNSNYLGWKPKKNISFILNNYLKTKEKIKMFKFKYDYEFNLLGVENYNLSPRMIFIKKFIENHSNVEGGLL